jgi:hypothetical protein
VSLSKNVRQWKMSNTCATSLNSVLKFYPKISAWRRNQEPEECGSESLMGAKVI